MEDRLSLCVVKEVGNGELPLGKSRARSLMRFEVRTRSAGPGCRPRRAARWLQRAAPRAAPREAGQAAACPRPVWDPSHQSLCSTATLNTEESVSGICLTLSNLVRIQKSPSWTAVWLTTVCSAPRCRHGCRGQRHSKSGSALRTIFVSLTCIKITYTKLLWSLYLRTISI